MNQRISQIPLGLFLAQFGLVWVLLFLPHPPSGNLGWPDGLLLLLATASTLASLHRELPAQNVVLATMVIGAIAGVVETVGAFTAFPFGRFTYTQALGPRIFQALPVAVPMMWIVTILNSRGVARLLLRPWRQTNWYGLWVLGVTTFLTILFDLGVETFATCARQYWVWPPTTSPVAWYGAPAINFIGWAATTLIILSVVTPSLINKRPVSFPPNYHPLILWLLFNVLFATAALLLHFWLAASLVILQISFVGILVRRGAESPC